jgi:signal transduction histidine kinase
LWRFTDHSWLPLAGFALTLLLGGYILTRNPLSALHRIFALLNVTAALWNLDVFLLFTIQDGEIAGAVDRLFQPALISLLFFALLFIYVFLGKKPTHPVVLLFGTWTLILCLISPYDGFISGWQRHWYGFYGRAGAWYVLFPLLQFAYLVLTVPPLLRESRRAAHSLRRSQALFLLAANLVFGVVSIDNFAPLYGGERMPVGNLAAVIYFFIIAATIVRHRLLDVQVVLRYGLLYSVFTLFLSGTYLLLVLGLQGWFQAEVHSGSLVLPMLPALALATAAVPVRNFIQEWVDSRVFPVRARMRALLAELPGLLSEFDREEDAWRVCWERGWGVVNPLWATVEIAGSGDARQFVPAKKGKGGGPIVLKVPVRGREGLLGHCCFGEKANGITYGEEEVLFLRAVAAQCALAVERARMAEESRRKEQLAALGKAAAVVSHELRNPLNVIRGAARLLRSGAPSRDPAAIIAMVEDQIRRGDRFINEFLAACREPRPRRVVIDVEDFVRGFAGQYHSGDEAPGALAVTVSGRGSRASVDPFQLQQVLENLVRNSVEAGSVLAEVTITCAPAAGGWVSLSVSDRGPGIPDDMLSSMFEPFESSRRNGTGLGLPIVKSIVEAHGGRIEAGNSRAGGARFDLLLPGVPAGKSAGGGSVKSKPSGKGEHR